MKRLSRGTPHFMTDTEIETVLASITSDPVLEEAIAAAFDMTLTSWRKQPKGKRVALWQQLQERGRLSAVGAQSIKARREFIEQSFLHQRGDDDPNALADRIKNVESQVTELAAYIRGTSKKGA